MSRSSSSTSTQQTKTSAWRARRIRKRRQRHRARIVGVALVAALALMLLVPLVGRMPRMEDMAVFTERSEVPEIRKCLPTTSTTASDLVVRQGTGTYRRLDQPFGKHSASNSTQNDSFEPLRLSSWSQYGQDLWVDTYFGQKRGGLFVEVGGYDGETHSNTLFLEKERGWQGLLVEANPYSFEIMTRKGRSCWMAHACIQSHNHSALTFQLAGGITSAVEVASAQHQQRIRTDLPKYRHQSNWKGAGETVCMPCTPFRTILDHTSLLEDNDSTVIDYFSLDVEGAELVLLQTLLDGNDNKNSNDRQPIIRLFTVEMQEHAHEIRQFMAAKNYQEIATVGIDSVFALKT